MQVAPHSTMTCVSDNAGSTEREAADRGPHPRMSEQSAASEGVAQADRSVGVDGSWTAGDTSPVGTGDIERGAPQTPSSEHVGSPHGSSSVDDVTGRIVLPPTGDDGVTVPRGHLGLVSRPAVRALLTVFFAWWAISTVSWSMPAGSEARRLAVDTVEPGVHAFGLDQSWVVFSPNPPREVVMVEADVLFADGTSRTWTPPRVDPFIGHFNGYHWQKWEERIRLDENADAWPATARYIASTMEDQGTVEQVILRRRWYEMPPIGDHAAPDWQSYDFYSWRPEQG